MTNQTNIEADVADVLYRAFIEMRLTSGRAMSGVVDPNEALRRIYALADLFHELPRQLAHLPAGEWPDWFVKAAKDFGSQYPDSCIAYPK